MQHLKDRLPDWVQDWLQIIVPGVQILLILLAAWLLQRLLRRLVRRASMYYQLPSELLGPINGLMRWLILASALLLVLDRMGISAAVLWAAFTRFATLPALALFCALLISTVRPYRIGDYIEVLDIAETMSPIGRVVDINLLYTTLEDHATGRGRAWLQIPNAMIFQRVVRRFQGVPPPCAPRPAGTTAAANPEPPPTP